jgi:N-acetylglucosaminyldiphosphoundecaprenol N-acetyl-beta-D-mannosaminyltransferase
VQSVVQWIEQGAGCRWLACINHHSYVVAKGDRGFADALRSADWLIPDGAGFVLASRLWPQGIRERITGSDIFLGVNEALEGKGGGTVFFLGSTDESLALIRARMRRDFPNVRVVGFHSPPFMTRCSEADVDDAIARINEVRPDVLWVLMNAPQQERWIYDNKERLGVKFAAALGDALDSYGERKLPVVRQRLGLEWLPKPLRDRRAWRATFVSAPRFLWDVLKATIVGDGAAEEPLPLALTPPPVERVGRRSSSMTTAAVGTASAPDSQEARQ